MKSDSDLATQRTMRCDSSFQNSIRHNLSLHSKFVRVQNEGTGKSSWWMLNPDAKASERGKSSRRRPPSTEGGGGNGGGPNGSGGGPGANGGRAANGEFKKRGRSKKGGGGNAMRSVKIFELSPDKQLYFGNG